MKKYAFLALLLVPVLLLAACGAQPIPLRSDMPTSGLQDVATYTLEGPASNPNQQVNQLELRGVNDYSPLLWQTTIFDQISGIKTQDVLVHGQEVLGMAKIERCLGYTGFSCVETATYWVEAPTGPVCGLRVRMKFNRNLMQYRGSELNDFDALFAYDVPCTQGNGEPQLLIDQARLRSLTVSEVWQARIATGSFFFNWGHSVTVVGGLPSLLTPRWWEHGDLPGTENDSLGVAWMLNHLVNDLSSSPNPWVEFTPGGTFEGSGSYAIYSAGDADQYATFNRALLNRQEEYVVLYRPNRETSWDFVTIRPVYDWEWNNAGRQLAILRGWIRGSDSSSNIFNNRLNEVGLPKNASDSVIAEVQRIGWMNAPNASLNQIQFISSEGEVLYAMTVRAFVGAADSLVVFGAPPPARASIDAQVPQNEIPPVPVLYNEKGERLSVEQQPYTAQQWADFQRESTIWNWLKDNPDALGADLFVQYRFEDGTEWAPIPCSDGGTCGYRPVEWRLATSYFFDGQVRKPWLVMNLLGEVGVRTLGISYASGRYEGTGMMFAIANREFYNLATSGGMSQESVFMLDSRAMTYPDTLAEAWASLHNR